MIYYCFSNFDVRNASLTQPILMNCAKNQENGEHYQISITAQLD